MRYWVILPGGVEGGVILLDLPGKGPKSYEYSEGISIAKEYPNKHDAIMLFDPDYEDQTDLYDFIDNTDEALIVSDKAKAVISELQLDNIEFLPVTIWDHLRSPVAIDYYIVNCLGAQPIIDMGNSECRMNPLNDSQVSRIKNLVVDSTSVDEKAHLFRASTKLDQYFISDELKVLFESAGVTAMYISEANGWDGCFF